ncbi:MAG TPA: adenylate/guanylate cyclase domain-containing protein, partial [Thermoplasmata archaeon]|nr:adenylate/guanylate cyclase domain-containing protein [Thermoplasmata archaeon]
STQLAQRDEKAALQLLRELDGLARPTLEGHRGRLVKSTGDGLLAEFGNALDAVECAVDFQRRAFERSSEGREPLKVRIGIHVGDVESEGTDILGDAVNIAARIEPMAEAGGICLSGPAYDQISNKVPYTIEKLGPKSLKGVARLIDVYRVLLPWAEAPVVEAPGDGGNRRLAVLPLANMSSDPENEYFADGMTEELISTISRVPTLSVISRTSVMPFKKPGTSLKEIGRQLDAGWLLEGSVRKAGTRVRITVQLIQSSSDHHLWAQSYDRGLEDVFAIQSEIAEKVAAELQIRLSPAALSSPGLRETQDMAAYLSFLQGQALVYKLEEEPVRQALKFFERAVEKDPTFARAYIGIARAYQRLGHEGYVAWSEGIRSSRAATESALAIAPGLAEAHAMLAEIAFMADEGLSVVRTEAHKALELNPNLGGGYDLLGQVAAAEGDLDGYVRHTEAAYRLDPLSPLAIRYLGQAYLLAGRPEDAMAHWKKTLHLDPIGTYGGMADYYLAKGDLDGAETVVQKIEQQAPDSERAHLNRGYLAALRGDRATALEMIRKLDASHEPGWARSQSAGFVYFALGDLDRFFEYMYTAARDHTLSVTRLLYSPLFAEARKDPRFQQVIAMLPAELRPS